LPGVIDVALPLFESSWLREAARELEDDKPGSAIAEHSELAELVDELQEGLRFHGERPAYAVPDLRYVDALETTACRAYCEHPPGLEHVARMSTAELATRIEWVHKHRGRGLSDLDRAVQEEWQARALGLGYFYGRAEPWLPPQLVELAGRRAPVRRVILAALCLSIVKRANGVHLSAADAQRLWSIAPSTWWSAIAWLEARGLLVRLRSYKPNDGHGRSSLVQFGSNWYGPAPELVAIVDRVLAAFGASSPAAIEAEQARAHDELLEARRARARAQRERERPELGKPAPGWAMAVAAAAFAAAASTAANADAGHRLEAMRTGELAITDAIGRDPPPPPLDVELELELERLVDAMPPDTGPRELEAMAARRELGCGDASAETTGADESTAPSSCRETDVASTFRRSPSADLSQRTEDDSTRHKRIATAPQAIAVQSPDSSPAERESRQKGSAQCSSTACSAAPSRARDDGDNVPSSVRSSSPTTAGREVSAEPRRSDGDNGASSSQRSPPATAGPPRRPRLAELVARAAAAFGFGVSFDDDREVDDGTV
jgi:hypothetical protein